MKGRPLPRQPWRLLWRAVLFGLALPCALALGAAGWQVQRGTGGRIYEDPARLSAEARVGRTGVVLGNSRLLENGAPNPHFEARMDAAARLFAAGRVRELIVSGNNDGRGYDEPAEMRAALVARGVPAEAVRLDPAGFRTLDTTRRARTVFGLSGNGEAVFITDPFHAPRTLFLADHGGPAGSVAFVGAEVPWGQSFRSRLRECLADVRACLDVYVLKRA